LKEILGYKSRALKAITDAAAEIGDTVRVIHGKRSYEGILIPRSEYGDEEHVVVKLRSGYNVGVRVTQATRIEKVGKGTPPKFEAPPLPKQRSDLPKVVILSTGGTIASRVDYRTGAVRPAMTASDLYSVVPELADLAQIKTRILLSLFSEHIKAEHWTAIAEAVAEEISDGADGVIVTHGTDTMGYTAAALSFALQNLPVPVVLVGSQRSSDRPSSDAATNLIGALKVAAEAPFAHVTLAMHRTVSDTSIAVHLGTKVRKCHTSRRDTFKSVNASPIASVDGNGIVMLASHYARRDRTRQLVLKPKFSDKAALIKFHPNMNPKIIDWYVENGYRGLVLEGSGLGHISDYCFDAIRNAVKHNLAVSMASQCIWGRVNMNVYDSGRDLQAMGVVPLDDMLPETAIVKLMWIFGQTDDADEARVLLKKNISGEFSPRTLPDSFGVE
jgi:glutamyl-tRNA(Gln) amidotransferase subunit D